MRLCLVLAMLLLCSCSSGNSPAPIPSPLPQPFSGDIPASAPWAIRDYTSAPNPPILRPLERVDEGWRFSFIQEQWTPGYIETPLPAVISGRQSVSIEYELLGDNPVLDPKTADNNTCGGPATVSALLHAAGDNAMIVAIYRQYGPVQELTLGTHQMRVPLTQDQWINVDGQNSGLETVKAGLGSVGIVLGGGCFRGHGLILRSGSATFLLKRYSIN